MITLSSDIHNLLFSRMKSSLTKRSLGQGYPVSNAVDFGLEPFTSTANNKMLATTIEAVSMKTFYIFRIFPFCLLENCWTSIADKV